MTETNSARTRDCNLSRTREISRTTRKTLQITGARTYRLRCHSWESSRINSRMRAARRIHFVYPLALPLPPASLFFLVRKENGLGLRATENITAMFRLSMIERRTCDIHRCHHVPKPRLMSKTKYLIFSLSLCLSFGSARKWNFLLAWKETAKPRVLNSSLRRPPR